MGEHCSADDPTAVPVWGQGKGGRVRRRRKSRKGRELGLREPGAVCGGGAGSRQRSRRRVHQGWGRPGAVLLSLRTQVIIAYLRKCGILVSMRTRTILRTLVLVFVARAYAKTVYPTFCVRKLAFSGFAYVRRENRSPRTSLKQLSHRYAQK